MQQVGSDIMELGMKCFECRFVFDDGCNYKNMVKYVFAKDINMVEKYLRSKVEVHNDDYVSELKITEIQVMEGVVL